MLSERFPLPRLRRLLLPREHWRPFPPAAERTAWEALPARERRAAVADANAHGDYAWPAITADLFLDYVRNGNRSRFEAVHFARRNGLTALVLGECVEGRGRFVDAVANGVWALCEESFWGVSAHVGLQKAGPGLPDVTEPVVDLFAAETAALLAWTAYLLGPELDRVSPLLQARIQVETQRRILDPLLARDDFWWLGFAAGRGRPNNWNPWINSNWLACSLLMEVDPARRVAAVAKSLRSLDRFLDPYPRDGGCDEGPSYWGRAGASLFDCLELLHSATGGRLDAYDEPLVGEIGRYIARVQIGDRYFVNFADAPAVVSPPAAIVYGYGQRLGDAGLTGLGAWLARHAGGPQKPRIEGPGRRLQGLFTFADIANARAKPPLPRDAWLGDIQVMVARDRAGSNRGLFVAAKGGHNAESHNHNDVGTFIVYVDGLPVLVDAGVDTYTAKTFSAGRYDLWTMQSAFHSLLPTAAGIQQCTGPAFAARDVAYRTTDTDAEFSLDLAGAYPPAARLTSWHRTVRLERGAAVHIDDAFVFRRAPRELTLSLVTPCAVDIQAPRQRASPRRGLAGASALRCRASAVRRRLGRADRRGHPSRRRLVAARVGPAAAPPGLPPRRSAAARHVPAAGDRGTLSSRKGVAAGLSYGPP